MKKSTIWLLTIVMAVTFGGLLYFQIMYLENMVKMRTAQFTEGVKRSLYETAGFLEKQETLRFLEEDASIMENSIYDEYADADNFNYNVEPVSFRAPVEGVGKRYKSIQEVILNQYLYQKGLLNEVILNILSEGGNMPAIQRADSVAIKNHLSAELANNGINLPFEFAIDDADGTTMYSCPASFMPDNDSFSQVLYPHTSTQYFLKVHFPSQSDYIFHSVRFIIPTLAFTVILLVIFIYIICLAFRQKKLTEMKTDFINNMTHELKTPISTISLAAQMLNDESVRKSPAMLSHAARAITEESKRLRFQVETVLQMSMFDNSQFSFRITTVDADEVITNVVSNFKIKVEKFGGKITTDLRAENPFVEVDNIHFTNLISNLLDNAVKYRREEVSPELTVTTYNPSDQRLCIIVSDNGIGIKRDDQKRIFDKFFRVNTGNRHDVRGFGLGLAYVKKMVEAFGGSISVESELGKGTTFTINMPVTPYIEEDNDNSEIN